MAEVVYLQLGAIEPQRSTTSRALKVGIGLIGGSCLVLLGIMAISAYNPTLDSSSVASTSLVGLQNAMRFGMKSSMQQPTMSDLRNLPGDGPWKELAIAGIEAANRCDRDVSANAQGIKAVIAKMDSRDKAMVAKAAAAVDKRSKAMVAKAAAVESEVVDVLGEAGIVAPLGFWDPLGASTNKPPGKLLFYREAELKHGRVCMLAALGFLVGEQFHPLFGGNINVPSYIAFQETPLEKFWYIVSVAIAIPEVLFAIPTFKEPVTDGTYRDPDTWTMKEDGRVPGDLGFDPLGLKPKDPAGFLEMQNKEILNGRLAMIATAGMVAQELVTKEKLFR